MAQEKSQLTKSQVLPPNPRLPKDILPSDRPALTKKEQKRLNDAFINAASKGDTSELVQLIHAGADIDAKGSEGWTSLHIAAAIGFTQFCALLIDEYAKSGGDVKALIATKDENGWTILHGIAGYGPTRSCVLLIQEYAKAGGDIKELIAAKTNNGNTALQCAEINRDSKNEHFLTSIENLNKIMGKETFNSFMKSFGDCVSSG